MNRVKYKNETNVVFADQYRIMRNRKKRLEKVQKWDDTNKFVWHAHQSSLWNRE